ncbi:MAG: protein-glutamate O-methyltransferase CheR [Bacillaceae bacterium]|nr:protein-glutamate O-methyltransferase CheR [Bacillaceae bacterium]
MTSDQDQEFIRFIQNIKNKTGIDLSLYKEGQMKRRLTSFRIKKGFADFDSFFKALSDDPKLMEEFLDRMTINVSEFFRNPGRWEVLENKIIPDMLKEKRSLNVWSAACSTGEEPYTIAILLNRFLSFQHFRILATDIDEAVLRRAGEGIYEKRSLKNVSPDRLNRYFDQVNNQYQVKPDVKKSITFKRHNLLADPFQKDFDLIVCRNVIIYFTDDAKHKLYQKFSQSLRPGGILFVGSTEQIFHPHQYGFEPYDTFFYRKVTS